VGEAQRLESLGVLKVRCRALEPISLIEVYAYDSPLPQIEIWPSLLPLK